MRVSISNLAWDVLADEQVATLLSRHQVDAIDIAPGKYFPEPAAATDADIGRVRQWWQDRGVGIVGMQALLFGTTGLNVFGSPESQQAMLKHLQAVARIGAGLGATRLVFGSPKNRDRAHLDDAAAADVAQAFFHQLGEVAAQEGVVFCLEPNPTAYGANFMVDSLETARVVEAVAHPQIRMQLDTGAMTMNQERIDQVVPRCAPLYGHVHASEPQLIELGTGGTDHAAVAQAMKAAGLSGQIVTIEMLPSKVRDNLDAIDAALRVATSHYAT
jgi:D-psicose/D-tagatose/L-ribulose 3-epimerase